MKEKVLDKEQIKCSSCGGNLVFSPDDKALKCTSCEKIEKLEYSHGCNKHDYFSNLENKEEYNDFVLSNNVFKCSNCGAKVVLNKLEVSKKCPYCGAGCVIDENAYVGLKPDGIIPFEFSSKVAQAKYVQGVKKKWFLPNKIKKAPPIDEISGIYIPTFSFDAKTHTKYSGTLENDKTITDSQGRTHTRTETFHVSGTKDMQHTDILMESSSHIDQIKFNAIQPYDVSKIVKFDNKFILGYSVEYYNQSLENCKKVANNTMEEIIKRAILAKYSYDRVSSWRQDTIFSEEKYSYYIVPTYKVSYKYKNKNYITFMNGQTGAVGGGLPRSALKITLFVLMIILIVAALVAAFVLL